VEEHRENKDSRFQIQDSKIYQALLTGCQCKYSKILTQFGFVSFGLFVNLEFWNLEFGITQ